MLKQIRCDKFNNKIINFHTGLNVVLGDNKATNSIGKSTLLMIIDFIFGGNSYITKNNDVVDNIGHHSFNFELEFDNEKFYFIRNTENHLTLSVCDKNYNKIKDISLDEYKIFLAKKYDNEFLGNSFRSVVGNYSRIWGKDNYDVEKPLKQQNSNSESAIINIIKLFNKYKSIESLEKQMRVIEDKKKTINKAVSNELIPSITKVQYNKNLSELENLDKKIDKIKNEMVDINLDINAIMSEEVLELKNQKSSLLLKRNHIANKIKRLETNLNSDDIKINSKMEKLVEFFPNINKNKLIEINDFHKNMSTTLKKNLKDEKENLENYLKILDGDIRLIDSSIAEKTKLKSVPQYGIERLTDLLTKQNNLKQMNEYYEKKQKNLDELNIIKESLKEIKSKVISEITKSINIEMYNYFSDIYNDIRKSPTFSMDLQTYNLKRYNDRGTGSSYINLITFDLAIFKLTKLPFLIHDSILFKNIQVLAFDNLVNIYKSFERQTFIAIDEINKFSKDTIVSLENSKVVALDEQHTLFNKNWKLDS